MLFEFFRKPSVLYELRVLEWNVGCGDKEGLCGVSWGMLWYCLFSILSHLGIDARHAALMSGPESEGVERVESRILRGVLHDMAINLLVSGHSVLRDTLVKLGTSPQGAHGYMRVVTFQPFLAQIEDPG